MAMKRGRNSRSCRAQAQGHSITDLPLTILLEIVLKLSAKCVIMCKSVCKTWRGLISNPQFANLYLERAEPCVLIQDSHYSRISRGVYFFGPADGCEFKDMRCRCLADPRCTKCRVKAQLKIPAWNVQAMFHRPDGNDCCTVNSCNGLICLAKTNFLRDSIRTVVWNPITGEFVQLPRTRRQSGDRFDFGLGFSPRENQYKIFRVRKWHKDSPVTPGSAEVHTLGTSSWRSIDSSEFKPQHEDMPSYLNGALYWMSKSFCLASFDLDDEKFRVHSIPSACRLIHAQMGTEVIGSNLYLYSTTAQTRVDIWVMEDCGNSLSWIQLFLVNVSEIQPWFDWFPYRLVCCINNEAVVLFGGPRNEFIYQDRSGILRMKRIKFRGRESSEFELISFTPSFISLKDIVMAGTIKEVDVKLSYRGGKLKLLEETDPLFLGRMRVSNFERTLELS